MTTELKNLPVGYQDFSILRKDDAIYIDKTEHLYNLISSGRIYFLSRPRRFGKSLMISTLEYIFKAQKDLFEGTWIANSDYDWQEHPVIHIDMSKVNRRSVDAFNTTMVELLSESAKSYGLDFDGSGDAAAVLNRLIVNLADKCGKVVVLVDEYDKPILDNLSNMSQAKAMRDLLRDFYTILKAQDGNMRFLLLTGVTKFSKISVFSGLNNPEDLTMADRCATLLGYTQSELEASFEGHIKRLADKNSRTIEDELVQIKKWYNGYHFSSDVEGVYNPFSCLLLFQQIKYRPHWYATGTPTFLIDLIEERKFDPYELEGLNVSDIGLESKDIDQLGLVALLYQTGYLTIESYDQTFREYKLAYPNFEVRESFTTALLGRFSEVHAAEEIKVVSEISRAIVGMDAARLFGALQIFLASIPYELHQPSEKYYQTIFYLIFRLVGYRIDAEVSTNIGRIDAILELPKQVIVFELKINQSAKVAMDQIHEKKYYQPYQGLNKKITLFGVNFDTNERNITEWFEETV